MSGQRESSPVKLRQYQQDALDIIRARLNPSDPGFSASPAVAAALSSRDVRVYINSHVNSLLDMLEGKGYYGQRADTVRYAEVVRHKRATAPPQAPKTLADMTMADFRRE